MKILAIGSHPDDIEFGCGGTIAKCHANGAEIHYLMISNFKTDRFDEQMAAATIFDAEVHWATFKDTEIPCTKELIDFIEGKTKEINPSLIFTHYPKDTHQDHRAVSKATLSATRYFTNVLFYEAVTTIDFRPTIFTDITLMPLFRKTDAIKKHQSQINKTNIKDANLIELATSIAVFRGIQARVKHAEGFVPVRFLINIRGNGGIK